MLFCPTCENTLDISKTQPKSKKQHIQLETPNTVSSSEIETDIALSENNIDDTSNNINTIIIKMAAGEKISDKELNEYRLDQFVKNKTYQKLDKKTKPDVLAKLVSHFEKLEDSTSAFYVCKNCMYARSIDSGTLIASKMSLGIGGGYTNFDKFKNMIYNKTSPRTKNYICIDEKCVSHKDNTKREAVFYRMGDGLQVWYTCVACQNYWKGE